MSLNVEIWIGKLSRQKKTYVAAKVHSLMFEISGYDTPQKPLIEFTKILTLPLAFAGSIAVHTAV